MTEYSPKPVWYSWETQKIANKMPHWMKIRREQDSYGQALLGVPGRRIEKVVEQLEWHLRSRFLELVETDEPDLMRRTQLPPGLIVDDPTQIENYLLNSSFEILTSHDRLPDHWQAEGSGVSVTTGILGARALSLLPAANSSAAVYQEFEEPIRAGVTWCFYVWYKSSATGLTAPATGFGLEAIGTFGTGATETLRASFSVDTYGYPKRALILGSFSADVVKVKFRLVSTHTSGSFPITTPVVVDICMAGSGNQVRPWKPYIFDNYPWLDYWDHISPLVCEYGTRAQFVERLTDFWTEAIPTRASGPTQLSSGGTADLVPSPGSGWILCDAAGEFTAVDDWNKEWPGAWEIGYDGSNSRVRGLGTVAADVLGPFQLAFRNWRNYFDDSASWTPEAVTWLHGYLAVVLKKQDYASTTRHYLAMVDVRAPRPFPTYLEVVSMIELPGLLSTTLTRADIRYADQQHLYVGDGATEWVYDLHYDYFMFDFARKIIYTREDYGSIVPQLMVRSGEK